jgi:hypothetical protein
VPITDSRSGASFAPAMRTHQRNVDECMIPYLRTVVVVGAGKLTN